MSTPRKEGYCQHCGEILPPYRKAYCSIKCREDQRREDTLTGHGRMYATPYIPKPKRYRSPITDHQQMALNQQVDQRYAVQLEPPRRILPGDPDFDRIASQCRDPRQIPNRFLCDLQPSVHGVKRCAP